jgi:hypothetical protein
MTVAVDGVTAQQVRALRHADTICFDHLPDGTGRAIRRAENTGSGFEETIDVPVESSRVQNYGPGNGPWVGYASTLSAPYDTVTQTILRRIRTGSRVAFVWTRDNSSPVTKAAGIVVDLLDVVVQNGTVADTFRASTFIGLDNSARMIQRAH